jgi:hypothetical protein
VLAAPTEATSTPAQALQLQSVLLGRGRTPAAVISGELVLLGGRVQDARLMRVTEHSAVLQGPQGETTLHLLPAFSLAPSDRLAIRALSSQVPRPRLDLLPVADGTPTSQSRP